MLSIILLFQCCGQIWWNSTLTICGSKKGISFSPTFATPWHNRLEWYQIIGLGTYHLSPKPSQVSNLWLSELILKLVFLGPINDKPHTLQPIHMKDVLSTPIQQYYKIQLGSTRPWEIENLEEDLEREEIKDMEEDVDLYVQLDLNDFNNLDD